MEQNQFVLSIRNLDGFLQKEGLSRETGRAYYLRGLCYREMDPPRMNQAQSDFERAIRQSKDPVVQALAHVGLGHIYFETKPDRCLYIRSLSRM